MHVVDRVARDLEQPAPEAALAAELGEALERGREDLARDVLAAVGIGDPQPHVAVDAIDVAVVQRQERARVASRGDDELGVVVDGPHCGHRALKRSQSHAVVSGMRCRQGRSLAAGVTGTSLFPARIGGR